MKNKNELLRSLPKVDECLLMLLPYMTENTIPVALAKKAVQTQIEAVRQRILDGLAGPVPGTLDEWTDHFISAIKKLHSHNFRRVINGTGIVVHTNLGRSLLSSSATDQLSAASSTYTNLEFDLHTGKRGSRYALVEELICDLTGAESALVVNNNAAAVLITLETLAGGHEVIVSRGQLVEIGGSFRIPDIMAKSGACLVEVGATNRTHLYDYEQAISDATALLLRVHTSNFRMIGFTSEVPAEEMVKLGRKYGVPVMEDLGSGSFIDMSQFGLPKEPTVQDVLKAGVDVVTFSGDKLLGGPQAGIIVGRKTHIDRIKKNPLNRALRIDKFTLASLESTLRSYYDTDQAVAEIPTLRMIAEDSADIRKRARKFLRKVREKIAARCLCDVVKTESRVGGGALPGYGLESWAAEMTLLDREVYVLERDFRFLPVPIIGRIENDRYLIDFRTIQAFEVDELATLVVNYFNYAG
ncbi:MAG: L-seryl-tRNA(Sec) selenium transferase [Desulfocapsaceae bacterium]|jgi:L-seryl-tRNA(Ser) seleniumtransferase|nr:L-seryl-tRNA(Sec) selenium transferase [Desulfocapsaceae bacterium]